jgi:hypothetical protein
VQRRPQRQADPPAAPDLPERGHGLIEDQQPCLCPGGVNEMSPRSR